MNDECPGKRCPKDPPGRGHHWIIEPPAGSTSKGVCKHCNAVKNFKNSFERTWYEYLSYPNDENDELEKLTRMDEKRTKWKW